MDHTAEAEVARLTALESYQLLDTPPEAVMDRITELAAHLFQVQVALITLIDKERIWFKSAYGTSAKEMPRAAGLCSQTILSEAVNVVEDGITDARTMHNPMVTEMGFRFYAGIAIHSADGYRIGTLCLAGVEPRVFSAGDEALLRKLALLVEEQLVIKKDSLRNAQRQQQFTSMLAHSLKNTLTIFPGYTALIEDKAGNNFELLALNDKIRQAAAHMNALVSNTLDMTAMELNLSDMVRVPVDVNRCVARVVTANRLLAGEKRQRLFVNTADELTVLADETRLAEIIENLVNNAIKYSPYDTSISVSVYGQEQEAVIAVRDEGPGLQPHDFSRVFLPFTRLSALPTGGESSTGVGLATAKALAEAHGGRLMVANNQPGPGATFTLRLPLRADSAS